MSHRLLKPWLVAGAVGVVVVSAWLLWPARSFRPSPQKPAIASGSKAASSSPDIYQIGATPSDVFAGILAASIPDADFKLERADQRDALRQSIESWLNAYASLDPISVMRVMQESGVEAPETWKTQSPTGDRFRRAMNAVMQIRFDPGESRITSEPVESETHPLHGHPMRSGSRDAARPFLAQPDARARLLRREVLFAGTVRDAEGKDVPVTLGIEFALDPASKRWVPIRTALYDLPNEVEGNGPIL